MNNRPVPWVPSEPEKQRIFPRCLLPFIEITSGMNQILLKCSRRFCGHWLPILCAMDFCSNALGSLLFGGEQPAKQAEFWARIAAADVVYIGETHTSRRDHAYELVLIRAMIRSRTHFAVGWEMFDRTQQSELDRFKGCVNDVWAIVITASYDGHPPA